MQYPLNHVYTLYSNMPFRHHSIFRIPSLLAAKVETVRVTNRRVMMKSFNVPLRGPTILACVASYLLYPTVSQLSSSTVACICVVGLGVAVTLLDLFHVLHSQLRSSIKARLDNVVLDDVLRAIFDPTEGTLAVVTSTFVGNAGMYALPLSREQRIRLAQSCLWTSEDQARTIMTRPGGIRELLPESMQAWLHPEEESRVGELIVDEDKPRVVVVDSVPDDTSDDETTEDDTCDEASREPTPAAATTPPHHIPSPGEVIRSISHELFTGFVHNTLEPIPDPVLGGASVAAAVACFFHLYSSRRARRIAMGVIDGGLTFTFAGVALAAASALVAKHSLDPSTLMNPARIRAMLTGTRLRSMMRLLLAQANTPKVQGALALVVMWYFGRSRRRRRS